MALRSISLCAGVAGIDLGLRLADPTIRTVCYVEWAKFPAAVIAARIADQTLDDAPVWDDVGTFDGRPWRGCVDIVTAGFPCQPVSLAGQRRGMADERFIWGDIARIIAEVQPERVFLENVPGVLTADGGAFLDRVLGDLVQLGFDCEWDLFSAEETGAPHRRQRWFCLAVDHTTVTRMRWQRESERPRSSVVVSGSNRTLADTGNGLVPQPGRGSQGRDGAGPAGATVADSTSIGLRQDGIPTLARAIGAGSAIDADSRRRDVGNPESGARLGPAQRSGRHAALSSQESVADSSCLTELEQIDQELPIGVGGEARRESIGGGNRTLDYPDEAMADADNRYAGPSCRTGTQLTEPRSHRVYPPARNDYAGWADLPESAQPAVRRDVDGLADGLDQSLFAYRNDRLRAVGNGVVPLTVALAWIELNRRIGGA